MTWCADLASVRAAQAEAVKVLGELLSEDGTQFWVTDAVSLTVSDDKGSLLFRLDLGAVLAPAMERAANALPATCSGCAEF